MFGGFLALLTPLCISYDTTYGVLFRQTARPQGRNFVKAYCGFFIVLIYFIKSYSFSRGFKSSNINQLATNVVINTVLFIVLWYLLFLSLDK